MTRQHKLVLLVLLLVTTAGWAGVNPGGGFGLSGYGLTTYCRVPVPGLDFQVRADGALRLVGKSHAVDAGKLHWLVESAAPAVLIVALGWSSGVRLPSDLAAPPGMRIEALPTGDALALYNTLKRRGVRVAIHVHSTC